MDGDAVLNVKHITYHANKIKGNVSTCEIEKGMHDLVLSKKRERGTVFERMFEWMNTHDL